MSVFSRHDRTIRLEPGDEETLQASRRGWHLGSDAFRQEQLARMEGKLGQHHAGEMRRATAEAKGERIVGEELQRKGSSRNNSFDKRDSGAGASGDFKHGERAFALRDERAFVEDLLGRFLFSGTDPFNFVIDLKTLKVRKGVFND